ncbi:HNH endonuclease [Roseomonas sp. BN140053]|uniref:HNH endonuclease n=1 Tax=Roseomonas sp. BN140053 TaxID=3391898 RepID=UPI0039ECBBE3
MLDFFEALQLTVAAANARTGKHEPKLELPRNGRHWANCGGYLGHEWMYPSVDFWAPAAISTSFYFDANKDGNGLHLYNEVHLPLQAALSRAFPDQEVRLSKRKDGSAVVVRASERVYQLTTEEAAVVVADQYARMIAAGRRVFRRHALDADQPTLETLRSEFDADVKASLKDPESRRKALADLANKRGPSKRVERTVTVYERNPHVVADALMRADGTCQGCQQPAPFTRVSDGTPYLEVHHKIPLAEGGPDTPDNVIALCANCHRDRHYGPTSR